MNVRLETAADRADSIEVERKAFGSEKEVRIVEAVRDEEGSFALVAEEGGRIIGHVQLSRARVGDDPVLALGPIGVLPERQRQGVGKTLIQEALAEAGRRGEVAVVLLGDPNYYLARGFEPASGYGLRNPFKGQAERGFVVREEDFMLLPLDDRVRTLRGEVRWHPIFHGSG